jgi:hypothetical protein
MTFAAALASLEVLKNPYPGVRPFQPEQAHLFFGRDVQIVELLERLEQRKLVGVVGVSGSGKSSLVRAGLIPALERFGLRGKRGPWRVIVVRPAGAPFEMLARSLGEGADESMLRQSSQGLIQFVSSLPPGENLLLVVDQFEELFRYKEQDPVTEEDRRRRDAMADEASDFVRLILAAHRHSGPVYIVLTLRSDYLGECATFLDLPEALNDCQYLVPRLTREQRKQAVEGPLGRAKIASSVVQRVLNDAGDEPDQLPILQHALMRTWDHWQTVDPQGLRAIGLEDYEAIGGFENALNLHAEELLETAVARTPVFNAQTSATVPASELPTITKTIFKRLTARGRNNRERRDPAQLAELYALCGAVTDGQCAQVRSVVDLFRAREVSFLVPIDGELAPDTFVDIAHESLIRQWKELSDVWMREEVRSARTFLRLLERSTGEPLTGLDLADALNWEARRNRAPAWAMHYANEEALEKVLIFISLSKKKAQDEAARRVLRNRISIIAAVVFAAVAAFSFYLLTVVQHEEKRNAETARANEALQKKQLEAQAAQLDSLRREKKAELERDQAREALESFQALIKLNMSKSAAVTVSNPSAGVQPPSSTPGDLQSQCQAVVSNGFRKTHVTPFGSDDVQAASAILNVPVPVFLAFLRVETSPSGFLADGRPVILFERHIFSRLTGGKYDAKNPDISNRTPGGYGASGQYQYDRLAKAAALDCGAALQAASWGLGQIMGQYYRGAGYSDVVAFVSAQASSEATQLHSIAIYLKALGVAKYLEQMDWRGFALAYNGSSAVSNNYSGRLQAAYQEMATSPPDWLVRAAQFRLVELGFFSGPPDGYAGAKTIAAIKAFQTQKGLDPDGLLSARTMAMLDK